MFVVCRDDSDYYATYTPLAVAPTREAAEHFAARLVDTLTEVFEVPLVEATSADDWSI